MSRGRWEIINQEEWLVSLVCGHCMTPLILVDIRKCREHCIPNTNGDWDESNKDTIVIQLGDLLDRGGRGNEDTDNYMEEIEILQFIQHLHKQASDPNKNLNSAFITLIGNHELMNLLGDFRYVSKLAMQGMGGEEGRRQLFSPGGPIAKHIGCSSYGI